MAHAGVLKGVSVVSTYVGLAALAWIVFCDVPMVTGMVFICGPDPEGTGRVICFVPSPLGIGLRMAVSVGGIWLGIRFRKLFYAENIRNGIRF